MSRKIPGHYCSMDCEPSAVKFIEYPNDIILVWLDRSAIAKAVLAVGIRHIRAQHFKATITIADLTSLFHPHAWNIMQCTSISNGFINFNVPA